MIILGLYLLFMPWLCSKEMIISKFNFLSQWYFRLQPKYRKTCHKQKLKSASLLSTSLGETAGTHFNNIFSLRPSLNSMFVCFWQSRSLLSRRLNNRPLEYLIFSVLRSEYYFKPLWLAQSVNHQFFVHQEPNRDQYLSSTKFRFWKHLLYITYM